MIEQKLEFTIYDGIDNLMERLKAMPKKADKRDNRPTLIKVGAHLIDPFDVSCITKIKDRNLYVVRLKSQPNMEYPIWVNKNNIDTLVSYFNILVDDIPEETDDQK